MKSNALFLVSGMLAFCYSNAQLTGLQQNGVPQSPALPFVYLQFDKQFYQPHDTVRFSGIVYRDGYPDSVLNTCYCRVFSATGKELSRSRWIYDGMRVTGEIPIPADGPTKDLLLVVSGFRPGDTGTIKANQYIIRIESGETNKKKQPIHFYPEGGKLVAGLPVKIVTRTTDESGRPCACTGIITSTDSSVSVLVKTDSEGYGQFQLKPAERLSYTARFTCSDKIYTAPLPDAAPAGIVIAVKPDSLRGIKINIRRTTKPGTNFGTVRLLAVSAPDTLLDEQVQFENYTSVEGYLDLEALDDRYVCLQVFDAAGKQMAQRWLYTNAKVKTQAIAIHTETAGNGMQRLYLQVPDSQWCTMSLSISNQEGPGLLQDLNYDLKQYQLRKKNTGALLEGNGRAPMLDEAMIALPLAENEDRPPADPIYVSIGPDLLSLKGVVTSTETKRSLRPVLLELIIVSEDSTVQSREAILDSSGRFNITALVLQGDAKAYFHCYNSRKESVPASLYFTNLGDGYPSLLQPATATAVPKSVPDRPVIRIGSQPALTVADTTGKLLENVSVRATIRRQKDITNERVTSSLFRNGGKLVIDNTRKPPTDRAMNGVDYVKNRINTITIQAEKFVNLKNFSIEDHTGTVKRGSGAMKFWDIGLFINEVPADLAQLRSLRADQIAVVKFYEAGALVAGSIYPGGAIAVYLNDGYVNKPDIEPEAKYFLLQGFPKQMDGSGMGRINRPSYFCWQPFLLVRYDTPDTGILIPAGQTYWIRAEGFCGNGKTVHIYQSIPGQGN